MKLLPQYPPLVNLEIIEIYEYYDFPCLFSCQNASGQIFLAVWIDETPAYKNWLYSPMSKGRLKNIRSGNIDLYDAFKKSEDGFIYHVVEIIFCEDINDECLPVAGETIDFSDIVFPLEDREKTKT
ncbi:hypothetical protein PN478_09315 [Dolichospermum circinale CS-534/05]|uniref:DUF6575 domain-containing protein n=1 Tax=Dolichospermum circinale TaxID=109265 RepID=UPI002330560E|nr:DUF6575 domain-containing protein [Dolichospermum circinale]MDB9455794.1 hypothetical protein [Dolichospermum circinale CS-541/06]MDB9463076.1 hypothetical protein [Dolichospermum circinale CS-541/04]MDB9490720.1 hypothetical protein [Dolichospermum circinale CS-534/05]MDB9546001.1 hypothetical protein [Dolichospermum circinale CS-1031]